MEERAEDSEDECEVNDEAWLTDCEETEDRAEDKEEACEDKDDA